MMKVTKRVIGEWTKPQHVVGMPSIEGLHVESGEREAWLQVGDKYVIVRVPNRLTGVRINSEGDAI